MIQRERNNDQSNQPSQPASGGAGGGNLNDLRRQAAALHAAADAAINNVLSGNSQSFNNAMRQEGGQ